MAEVLKFPNTNEVMKAINMAQEAAPEAMATLISIVQDDVAKDCDKIEAARTILYFAIELECTNNG